VHTNHRNRTEPNGTQWIGIGYNFYIHQDGTIFEGRGWNTQGSHAANFNANSIGIALQGNFQTQTVPEAQRAALVSLLGETFHRFPNLRNLMGNHVGHRDLPGHTTNACPGNNLHREMRQLYQNGSNFVAVVNAANNLRNRNVINTPNYWRDNFHRLEHLDTLLIRLGNTFIATTPVRTVTTLGAALNLLVSRGIINTPNHWLQNHHRVQWLDTLIIQFARHLP
jgi:hypothetical protein